MSTPVKRSERAWGLAWAGCASPTRSSPLPPSPARPRRTRCSLGARALGPSGDAKGRGRAGVVTLFAALNYRGARPGALGRGCRFTAGKFLVLLVLISVLVPRVKPQLISAGSLCRRASWTWAKPRSSRDLPRRGLKWSRCLPEKRACPAARCAVCRPELAGRSLAAVHRGADGAGGQRRSAGGRPSNAPLADAALPGGARARHRDRRGRV